jgi:ribosome-binding protein aMBF1 (putative translation factor)
MKNTVELIGYYGSDEIHAQSAWTSTSRELTEDKVRYIRKNAETSNSELSKKFKVDPSTIRDVKKFKTWKHVK